MAICDVYKPNLERAAGVAKTADEYGDFRRVLERKDVDAVSSARRTIGIR